MSIPRERAGRCCVCGRTLTDRDAFIRHERLDVLVCSTCPLTNVMGEDVSQHTLMFNRGERS